MSNLSDNAIKVLEKRYLAKDSDGNVIETPDEMFWRVANNIAMAERGYYKHDRDVGVKGEMVEWHKTVAKEFYDVMSNLDFLPNTPTLINAGRSLQMLSACFVLPVEDDMASIFDAVKNSALIHQAGGGTGFSFNKLRAKGSRVGSTGGEASGPISFMSVFNSATDTVKQGGTRRGANMGMLHCDHPDIEGFITCKKDGGFQNFNLSVALTDDFMEVVAGDKFQEVHQYKKILNKIAQHAWENGDPGVIFIDKMNEDRPHKELYEATNPCGEQPLLPYESCNLGSINLMNHLYDLGKYSFEDSKEFIDWAKLKQTVKTAVHFLDNVIDMNKYTLPEIEAQTKKTRKIGLGVMGWADILVALGIDYDSDEAVTLAKLVMQNIKHHAEKASHELALERGVNGLGMFRNSTVTTIAPTGSISIIAGCSGGIEPHFAKEFTHETGLSEDGTVLDRVSDVETHTRTAMEIAPEWHIKMQSAFQKYTDNAVSKTINMPNISSVEEVREAIILAWKSGCKGLTIYRDGSRDDQPLKEKNKHGLNEKLISESILDKFDNLVDVTPTDLSPDRPEIVTGETIKILTGCGSMYVTINPDVPEVFSRLGKAGGCQSSQTEALGRLISLCLKNDVEIDEITKQLNGISCDRPCGIGVNATLSCADAMSHALEKYEGYQEIRVKHAGGCPDCGGKIAHIEGCLKCPDCGYSEC